MHTATLSMSDWKTEDDIKAELRVLTGELKQLREELRNMVAPPKTNPSRAFLHRQAWPAPTTRDTTVVAKAADKPPKRRRQRTDRDK
jgi:hypothetical protein